MINGAPPKLHQLAGAIWYLSLQDRIDFLGDHAENELSCAQELAERRAVIPSFCGRTETRLSMEIDTHTTTLLSFGEEKSPFNKSSSLLL